MILPEKSGEKIAREIQSIHPETLVLYISGYGDARSETTPGQPRLLQKPFTGSELLLAVRQVLSHPGRA
jgi:DNA-binding NtrC family response regulator